MPTTTVRGAQITNATIQRQDLDTTTVGQALVTKLVQGTNVTLSSTGADSGTGDVTINVPTGGIGPAGLNAFNITSGSFIVPPVGSTVTVTLNDASWVVVGQMVYVDQAGGGVGQAGALQVTAKTGNQITLLNPTPAPAIPPADTTQAGLLKQLSGNTTDFVGGDNACHSLSVGKVFIGSDVTNTGAYVVSVDSSFALISGVIVFFVVSKDNTVAGPTLNVNGSGPKSIVNRGGIAPDIAEIVSNKSHGAYYDGTSWRLFTSIGRSTKLTSPGTISVECAGYDSICLNVAQTNATPPVITLAHLMPAVPIQISMFNSFTGPVTFRIGGTSPAGTTLGAAYVVLATALTGGAYTDMWNVGFSLTNGNGLYLYGSYNQANGSLNFR